MASKHPMMEEAIAKGSQNEANMSDSIGIRTGNLRSAKCKPAMESQKPIQETNGYQECRLAPCVINNESEPSSLPFSADFNRQQKIEQMAAFISNYEQNRKVFSSMNSESEVMRFIDEAATFRKYISDMQALVIKQLWFSLEIPDGVEKDRKLVTYLAKIILSPSEWKSVKSVKSDKISSTATMKSKKSKARSDSHVENMLMKVRNQLEKKRTKRQPPTDIDFDGITKEFIVNLCYEIEKEKGGNVTQNSEVLGKRISNELDEIIGKGSVNFVQSMSKDPSIRERNKKIKNEIDEKATNLEEQNKLSKTDVDKIQQSSTFETIKCFIKHLAQIEAELWENAESTVRGESKEIIDLETEVIKSFRNTTLEGHRIYMYNLQGLAELAIKYYEDHLQTDHLTDRNSKISSDMCFPHGINLLLEKIEEDTKYVLPTVISEFLRSNDRKVLRGLRLMILMIKNEVSSNDPLIKSRPRIEENVFISQVCMAVNDKFQIALFWPILQSLPKFRKELIDWTIEIENNIQPGLQKEQTKFSSLKDDIEAVIKKYKEIYSPQANISHQFEKEKMLTSLLGEVNFKENFKIAFQKLGLFIKKQRVSSSIQNMSRSIEKLKIAKEVSSSKINISRLFSAVIDLHDTLTHMLTDEKILEEVTFMQTNVSQIENAIKSGQSNNKIYEMLGISASKDNNLLGKLDDPIARFRSALDDFITASINSFDSMLTKGLPFKLIQTEDDGFFKRYKKLEDCIGNYKDLVVLIRNSLDSKIIQEGVKKRGEKFLEEELHRIEKETIGTINSIEEDLSDFKHYIDNCSGLVLEQIIKRRLPVYLHGTMTEHNARSLENSTKDNLNCIIHSLNSTRKDIFNFPRNLHCKLLLFSLDQNFATSTEEEILDIFQHEKKTLLTDMDNRSCEIVISFLGCRIPLHLFICFGVVSFKDMVKYVPTELQRILQSNLD